MTALKACKNAIKQIEIFRKYPHAQNPYLQNFLEELKTTLEHIHVELDAQGLPPKLIELREKTAKLIKQHEGWMAKVYDDATGKQLKQGHIVAGTPTIGYGFTRLKRAQGDVILEMEIDDIITDYFPLIPIEIANLNMPRMAVYISMIYNLGWLGFKGFTEMRKAVRKKDWKRAAKEIVDSDAGRKLVARYSYLAMVMETGEL